ncbi:DUF3566 domain-containing protein [Flexivirga caeni]|uniref:DUF3566 domain-containing protein n=1 Tax=Flexivirga caeni TaxID=2294115 RepID=UPI001FEBF0EF|nr:DUF3566 domain-containing protein [Flexivirga caeni]
MSTDGSDAAGAGTTATDGGAVKLPAAAAGGTKRETPPQSSGARAKPAARTPGRAAPRQGGAPRRPGRSTPRRVRLTVSRVDPWSVMKIAFLLSVAIGIAMVVMIAMLWTVLKGMGVWDNINDLLRTLETNGKSFDIMDYVGFGRVVSLSVVIAFVDVLLMTAFATLVAFLYNICASLVGGVQMTLSDD